LQAGDFFEVYIISAGPPFLVASIRRSVVLNNPRHAAAFRKLMMDIVTEVVERDYGVTPTFSEEVR
jgi:hypothetical protein